MYTIAIALEIHMERLRVYLKAVLPYIYIYIIYKLHMGCFLKNVTLFVDCIDYIFITTKVHADALRVFLINVEAYFFCLRGWCLFFSRTSF